MRTTSIIKIMFRPDKEKYSPIEFDEKYYNYVAKFPRSEFDNSDQVALVELVKFTHNPYWLLQKHRSLKLGDIVYLGDIKYRFIEDGEHEIYKENAVFRLAKKVWAVKLEEEKHDVG